MTGPDELTELMSTRRLQRWMDDRSLGDGEIHDARLLAGGTQNVLIRFSRGQSDFVLRRGPRHLRPNSNDHLRREMRIVEALGATRVPHARLIAACPDESVTGSAFYLMDVIDGVNPAVDVPGALVAEERKRYQLGLNVVDALAGLGAVDHQAIGLAGIGRPDGFLERQPSRWLKQLHRYEADPRYPAGSLNGVDDVAHWLAANIPATYRPGVLHGDFHVGNVMVDPEGEVLAIVDWEMATVGDPLLDLGWLVATWPVPGRIDVIGSAIGRLAGLPTTADLVQRYAGQTARDVSSIDWYVVLACFKLAIVVEGTFARALAGLVPRATGDALHEGANVLMERAHEVISFGFR